MQRTSGGAGRFRRCSPLFIRHPRAPGSYKPPVAIVRYSLSDASGIDRSPAACVRTSRFAASGFYSGASASVGRSFDNGPAGRTVRTSAEIPYNRAGDPVWSMFVFRKNTHETLHGERTIHLLRREPGTVFWSAGIRNTTPSPPRDSTARRPYPPGNASVLLHRGNKVRYTSPGCRLSNRHFRTACRCASSIALCRFASATASNTGSKGRKVRSCCTPPTTAATFCALPYKPKFLKIRH